MKKLVRLSESKLINLIKNIILENEEDNYVEIQPEMYKKLLMGVNGNAQLIHNLPQFKSKKIRITGDLDLSDHKFREKITDLGDIRIDGRVDLSGTGIKTIKGISTPEHNPIRIWGTPYEKHLERLKRQQEREEAQERREENEWDLNNGDTTGEMAHAVLKFMEDHDGSVKLLDDEDQEKLEELRRKHKELEQKLEEEEDDEKSDDIVVEMDEVEADIEELMDEVHDVYDLVEDGGYYGDLTMFKSVNDETYGQKYAVGTEDQFDEALKEYYQDWIDSPEHYFSSDQLGRYIDGDEVAEYFEDDIRNNIYESPESYDIEKTLSGSQEGEIEQLEYERRSLLQEQFLIEKGARSPLTEEVIEDLRYFKFTDYMNNELVSQYDSNRWTIYQNGKEVEEIYYSDDDEDGEHEEENENRISEIEDRTSEIESEIEEIKDDPDGDLDDDSVEEAVEDQLSEIRDNPTRWLDDYGMDYGPFIDKDDMLDDLVSDSDYGRISGYDDTYDYYTINQDRYYVVRTD
jgi:hypothetical protein